MKQKHRTAMKSNQPIPTPYPDEDVVNTGNDLWIKNSRYSINVISQKHPLVCQAHKGDREDIQLQLKKLGHKSPLLVYNPSHPLQSHLISSRHDTTL
jgi:hypothetical protein